MIDSSAILLPNIDKNKTYELETIFHNKKYNFYSLFKNDLIIVYEKLLWMYTNFEIKWLSLPLRIQEVWDSNLEAETAYTY